MGKSAKLCTILVMDEALYQSTEVQVLKAKGHTVHERFESGTNLYDVIIGPQCWRVDPALGNLEAILEMVLKGVRARKFPAKKVTK